MKLARAQKWADFGVGLNAEHERSEDVPEGFERDTFVGLTFSLPLPLWNRNDGRVDETVAAAARARKEAEALAVNIRAEAATARGQMAVLAQVLAKLDDQLIPAAARLEEQFRLNYATGLTPLPEVLRARTRRLELERQRLDALRDYHLARVRHKTASGLADHHDSHYCHPAYRCLRAGPGRCRAQGPHRHPRRNRGEKSRASKPSKPRKRL